MSIANIFKSKETTKDTQPLVNEQTERTGFTLGVHQKFSLVNSTDIVVTGRLKGKVKLGDAVYVSNIGDDDDSVLLTTVRGIETGPNIQVTGATDGVVALRLENASKQNIKCGTVVFTRNISTGEVHNSYFSALGDVYVAGKGLDLTTQELDSLSITDCYEIWRLFLWFISKNKTTDEVEIQKNRSKIDAVAEAMCKKILSAELLYCIFSKATGEPYLHSRTSARQDGQYECTPPEIIIFTKAYKNIAMAQFPQDRFEVRQIENGEDKKGIENFFGMAFYLNGACGVSIISEQIGINANMLVKKPDYSQTPDIQIPITNPDLVRWMLLMAQIGTPDTDEKKIRYQLYCKFMDREIVKAKLLIPMKHSGNIPEGDSEGKTVLKEGIEISLPIIDGKNGRHAVRMYTDWKRLHEGMGEDWNGLVQSIEGIINEYDCAINIPTPEHDGGCYISKELFDSLLKN